MGSGTFGGGLRSGKSVGWDNICPGIVNYDITECCSITHKTGSVTVVAGQTVYITVSF